MLNSEFFKKWLKWYNQAENTGKIFSTNYNTALLRGRQIKYGANNIGAGSMLSKFTIRKATDRMLTIFIFLKASERMSTIFIFLRTSERMLTIFLFLKASERMSTIFIFLRTSECLLFIYLIDNTY